MVDTTAPYRFALALYTNLVPLGRGSSVFEGLVQARVTFLKFIFYTWPLSCLIFPLL